MNPPPQAVFDLHSYVLQPEKEVGESLELVAHFDGGITIATALKQPGFCDATQVSLTHDQALELCTWLAQALERPRIS